MARHVEPVAEEGRFAPFKPADLAIETLVNDALGLAGFVVDGLGHFGGVVWVVQFGGSCIGSVAAVGKWDDALVTKNGPALFQFPFEITRAFRHVIPPCAAERAGHKQGEDSNAGSARP